MPSHGRTGPALDRSVLLKRFPSSPLTRLGGVAGKPMRFHPVACRLVLSVLDCLLDAVEAVMQTLDFGCEIGLL